MTCTNMLAYIAEDLDNPPAVFTVMFILRQLHRLLIAAGASCGVPDDFPRLVDIFHAQLSSNKVKANVDPANATIRLAQWYSPSLPNQNPWKRTDQALVEAVDRFFSEVVDPFVHTTLWARYTELSELIDPFRDSISQDADAEIAAEQAKADARTPLEAAYDKFSAAVRGMSNEERSAFAHRHLGTPENGDWRRSIRKFVRRAKEGGRYGPALLRWARLQDE